MADPAPWANDPAVGQAQNASPAPAEAPWSADAPTQAPAQSESQPSAPAPDSAAPEGFTDEQQTAIQDYVPKAKDAADLERYSLEISGGRAKVGNAADVIAHRDKGYKTFAWSPATIDKNMAPKAQPESLRDTIGEGMLNGMDAVFPGVGQFIRDNRASVKAYIEHTANAAAADYGPEVGGAIDTATDPSQYGNFGQNLDRNIAHERAQMAGDSEGHPIASIAGELTGAALVAPVGGEAADALGAAKAAEYAPKAVNATKAALGGAAYGSGAAGPGNRAEGAATGATLSAGTDLAAPYLLKAVKAGSSSTANQLFDAAANRQGVGYMAADLPNSLKSKFATSLASLSFGAIPLAKQGERNIGSAATAASRVADNIGTVADSTGAGQAAQRGAQQFIQTTAGKLNDLENKIPIAANAPASVDNTRAALSGIAQSFQSNPKLAAAFHDPRISAFVDALTPQSSTEATGLLDASGNPITRNVTQGGGLSWDDLREFRSRIGQIIGQPGLTSDGAQMAGLRRLYGALSDDIQQTAQQNGPQAANAWNRWNNYARARANRIDNVVSLILGNDDNKAPQSAYEAMQRLGNERGGDPIKLGQALRSMPEDEANSVRATMLGDLGSASAGHQNDKGDVFSPAQWVTNWNKISDRAKNILFTGEHRKALDDLAMLFSGMKSSNKFANNSKTGISVVTGANAAFILHNPVLGSIGAALQYGGGKLLASPSFARRVAGTPLNAKAASAYWSRPWLKGLINQNPAIAGEIQAFAHSIANDNTPHLPVAASQNNQPQDQQANQAAP